MKPDEVGDGLLYQVAPIKIFHLCKLIQERDSVLVQPDGDTYFLCCHKSSNVIDSLTVTYIRISLKRKDCIRLPGWQAHDTGIALCYSQAVTSINEWVTIAWLRLEYHYDR